MNVSQLSGLSHSFWRHYHGNDKRASSRWIVAIFAMLVLFPGVGSGGSALFIGIWLFALPYLLFDRDSRSLTRNETTLLAVWAAYFLIMTGFAMMHAIRLDQTSGFGAVYSNLPFLLIGPVLPVLRRAARPDWVPVVFAGIAWGSILAVAIVTIGAYFFPEISRKALSGNPLILALGALISGLLCLHGALFFQGRLRWLTAIGAWASVFVLLTSGSRGPLLAYSVTATIYAAVMGYRHFGLRWMFGRYVVWLLLLLATATAVEKLDPQLGERYDAALQRLADPSDTGVTEKSVSTRLVLYKASIRAFLEHPALGYGRPNVLKAAQARSDGADDQHFQFSHLHNGYLTDLVASGLLGLLSLLAVLFVPLALFWNARPVVFGGVLCVVFAYVFYGATNLLFYHDVLTLLFLSLMCIFNAFSALPSGTAQSAVNGTESRS